MEARQKFRGGLVVISGPSGSGKTTIVTRLATEPAVDIAVTATTRPMREGEEDGVDYFFLTQEEFRRRIASGEFVEYNEVFRNGNLYGSLKAPLEEGIQKRDRYYVLEIDVEGGLNLKRQGYEGIYLFIAPPSLDALRARLEGRGTESNASLTARMAKTEVELKLAASYGQTIINDNLEVAYQRVRDALGLDESCKPDTQQRGHSPTSPGDE